jgi:RecA/RadA recombinase
MTMDRGGASASALAQIERAFGGAAIMRMGERKAEAVPVVSSGSLSLDLAMGIGGYPRGRIVEICGPESSGKSTRALHAVAEAQKAGGTHTDLVDGVVVHNSPETTTGGDALKFCASARIEVRRIEAVKGKDTAVGNKVRAKVVKNKMAPPFRDAVFEIVCGKDVSRASGILERGVAAGIVEKSGFWCACDGRRIGQGTAQAKAFLDADPGAAREIADRIRGVGAPVEG